MTQYIRCKIKMASNWNWSSCKKYLEKCGCKIETIGVFLQMKGFPVPDNFKLKKDDEKIKEKK